MDGHSHSHSSRLTNTKSSTTNSTLSNNEDIESRLGLLDNENDTHDELTNEPHHLHHQPNHHLKSKQNQNQYGGDYERSLTRISLGNMSIKSEKLAQDPKKPKYMYRVWSAVFYAVASFLITVVNKLVLTSSGFPSFQVLALGQITATVTVLYLAKSFKFVSYPNLGKDTFGKIFPLPLLFIGNAVTGLGGTKELSLPMFTALRRFSILLTMVAEFYILGLKPSIPVQISVYTMIGGAVLAASNDLTFTASGYSLVMLNNIFTASNGVYTKKKLESKEYGKYGLMYYNALFVIVPAFIIALFTGEISKAMEFNGWTSPIFLMYFTMSCFMGFVLNTSVVLCTQYNSALTTTIIGCLKNVSVTYLGVFIGGDYVYAPMNFLGINISVLGSLLYTYVTFRKK